MILAVWLGIGVIVVIALSISLSFFLTRRHTQQVVATPAEFGLDYQEIQFHTSDHLCLHGWWIPAATSTRTLVFLHGFSGSMDPDLKYTPAIHQAGYNILMFDFRAHGRSQGHMTTLGALEVRDAMAAIGFIRTLVRGPIGLLGFSMGGRAALHAAAECPRAVCAIVSDGGPLQLSHAILQQLKEKGIPSGLRHLLCWGLLLGASLRSGQNLFTTDPVQRTPQLAGLPIFLIHAELDPYTEREALDKMVWAIGKSAKLEVVPGVNHRETDRLDFDGYISKIIGFFNTNMNLSEEL